MDVLLAELDTKEQTGSNVTVGQIPYHNNYRPHSQPSQQSRQGGGFMSLGLRQYRQDQPRRVRSYQPEVVVLSTPALQTSSSQDTAQAAPSPGAWGRQEPISPGNVHTLNRDLRGGQGS